MGVLSEIIGNHSNRLKVCKYGCKWSNKQQTIHCTVFNKKCVNNFQFPRFFGFLMVRAIFWLGLSSVCGSVGLSVTKLCKCFASCMSEKYQVCDVTQHEKYKCSTCIHTCTHTLKTCWKTFEYYFFIFSSSCNPVIAVWLFILVFLFSLLTKTR